MCSPKDAELRRSLLQALMKLPASSFTACPWMLRALARRSEGESGRKLPPSEEDPCLDEVSEILLGADGSRGTAASVSAAMEPSQRLDS